MVYLHSPYDNCLQGIIHDFEGSDSTSSTLFLIKDVTVLIVSESGAGSSARFQTFLKVTHSFGGNHAFLRQISRLPRLYFQLLYTAFGSQSPGKHQYQFQRAELCNIKSSLPAEKPRGVEGAFSSLKNQSFYCIKISAERKRKGRRIRKNLEF